MSKEAMKQALEAYELEQSTENHGTLMQAVHDNIAEAEKQEQCTYPKCDYPCMNLPDCQEQEPVKWSDYEPDGVHHNKQEQGEPQQRTWVGLTDDEIEQGNKESWVTKQAFEAAVWWAEAKLKEKNGA